MEVARHRPLGPALVGALLLLSSAAAHAQLRVDTPDTIGDGKTQVTLSISVKGQGGASLSEIQAQVSAGTIVVKASKLQYTPPRIVEPLTVSLDVQARKGTKKLRLRETLVVNPPQRVVEYVSDSSALPLTRPRNLLVGEGAIFKLPKTDEIAPALASNLGTIAAPKPSTDGLHWEYAYTAADMRSPHFVYLLVSHPGVQEPSTAAIPVLAKPNLRLETEARAMVVVETSAGDFGPVRADARGRATVAVYAPPESSFRARAEDAAGHVTTTKIPSSAPPYEGSVLLCPDHQFENYLAHFTAGRLNATGAVPKFEVSEGRAIEIQAKKPGLYEFSTETPPSLREVTIALPRAAAEPLTCTRRAPIQAPTSLTMALSTESYQAGDGPISIGVSADFTEEPQVFPKATLQVSLGTVSEARWEDGRYLAQWTLPQGLEGAAEAAVSADVLGVKRSAKVRLEAGKPAELRRQGTSGPIRASRREHSTIVVYLADAFGNPINEAKLSAAARGRLGPFKALGGGTFRIRYQPPLSASAQSDQVRIKIEGLSLVVPVLVPAVPSKLFVEARVGLFSNVGSLLGPALLGALQYRFHSNLSVGMDLGYAMGSFTEPLDGFSDELRTAISTGLITPKMTYHHFLHSTMEARATLGGGLAISGLQLESEMTGPEKLRTLNPTVAAGAGLDFAVGPGLVTLDLAYRYAKIDIPAANGNALGLLLTAGYRYGL